MERHNKLIGRISNLPGEKITEQKLALTRDLQPTQYFGKDVWMRSIADVAILHRSEGVGITLDYKTGKRRLDWEQVRLQAAVLMAHHPQIDRFKVGYLWTKDNKLDLGEIHRDELADLWLDLRERADRMEHCYNNDIYPAKQNFLCKNYCTKFDCPHNGRSDSR